MVGSKFFTKFWLNVSSLNDNVGTRPKLRLCIQCCHCHTLLMKIGNHAFPSTKCKAQPTIFAINSNNSIFNLTRVTLTIELVLLMAKSSWVLVLRKTMRENSSENSKKILTYRSKNSTKPVHTSPFTHDTNTDFRKRRATWSPFFVETLFLNFSPFYSKNISIQWLSSFVLIYWAFSLSVMHNRSLKLVGFQFSRDRSLYYQSPSSTVCSLLTTTVTSLGRRAINAERTRSFSSWQGTNIEYCR